MKEYHCSEENVFFHLKLCNAKRKSIEGQLILSTDIVCHASVMLFSSIFTCSEAVRSMGAFNSPSVRPSSFHQFFQFICDMYGILRTLGHLDILIVCFM